MCDHEVPEREEPAPVNRCQRSAVQAAITGGWSTTVRLIAVTTVPAVVTAALGTGIEALLTAVLQSYF
ncbi:hypothetical protein JCM9533A_48970 [Catenuloplanes niger JCM 9533]